MERKTITNINDVLDPIAVGVQVSEMIDIYNSSHPYEMLPKTPEVIIEQMANGLSVLIADQPQVDVQRVLFYASIYSNFGPRQEEILGMQIVELGSWIVPEYARGQGNGTEGVNALLRLAQNRWNPVLMLSTHKRLAALKVSEHNGLVKADYRNFPYLSYLTCTCTNCSEREGFETCPFRRLTPDVVEIGHDGKIACTLVISDVVQARQFEERCGILHSEMLGDRLTPGEISIDSMARAHSFFENLKRF